MLEKVNSLDCSEYTKMEALKIALVDSSNQMGGGQVSLANLAKVLAERGHEVHVILGLQNKGSRLYDTCSPYCHFHVVPGCNDLFDHFRVRGIISKKLSKLNKDYRFDVLNVNGIDALFVPHELLDRLVVTLHGNNLYRGLILLRYLHTSKYMHEAYRYNLTGIIKTIIGSLVYSALEKRSCERARRVVTLTQTEANLANHFYKVPKKKISVVPNPVCFPNGEKPLQKSPIPENKKILLSVCSLSLIKGIPVLVKAVENILSENKDVTYVSVGDGPLIPLVQDLASRFPRRVLILNHVSTGMRSIYAHSNVFIHGSLFEAFCLSMAEAMLVGKPVVAFNIASIPEMVINNVTGYLVEPLNPKNLAEKAIDLLDDDGKARKMGLAAKKRIEELTNSQRIACKMETAYKEAVAS